MAVLRQSTLVVRGYRELQLAFSQMEAQVVGLPLQAELKSLGEVVRRDAAARMSFYDAHSAAGFRVQTKATAMFLSQTRRSKHRRPQFGALQMVRALLPALDAHRLDIQAGFERLLDRVVAANFGL